MRCGDCKWLCGRRSSIGIECMNPVKREMWAKKQSKNPRRFYESIRYKAKSREACVMYEGNDGREDEI